MMRNSFLKKAVRFSGAIALFLLLIMAAVELTVEINTRGRLFNDPESISKNKVGLVPGTSKYRVGGTNNLYFKYRLEAAAELFESGKIDFILVSGDHNTPYYDEPTTMFRDLIQMGIPEQNIIRDYAGFRTLDSVIRSKLVFGQKSITIISQPFHNKRALFIADHHDIDAVAYNAEGVDAAYGLKTQLRERLARVKMVLDLIIGKEPKVIGDPLTVG